MNKKCRHITAEQITRYALYLRSEERARGTIEKYLRDAGAFVRWLGGRPVTSQSAADWKTHLRDNGYAPVTVNSMLAAVNSLFRFLGWPECRVRYLKIQRKLFRDQSRELRREDYDRLLETARALGRTRLAVLMETICATGIRVGEVRYITVEAVLQGRTEISLKGKIRTILIPGKLCRKLKKYAKREKITSGEIFRTSSGKGLSRRQIWAEMKALCRTAGVAPTKVFPHNLRHLFAATFYRACKDIAHLADILGHACIETTRIYLLTSGVEHQRQLDRLGLVT